MLPPHRSVNESGIRTETHVLEPSNPTSPFVAGILGELINEVALTVSRSQ